MHSDFVSLGGEPLDLCIVRVLVVDEEGAPNATPVRVTPAENVNIDQVQLGTNLLQALPCLAGGELVAVAEHLAVVIEDEIVESTAEADEYHLGHGAGLHVVGDESAVVGAEAGGQLALIDVARGQRLLAEFALLGAHLGLVDRTARERIGLEGAILELRVEVQARWTCLRPGLPVAAQVELATAHIVGKESIGLGTFERAALLAGARLRVVVVVARFTRCRRLTTSLGGTSTRLLLLLRWTLLAAIAWSGNATLRVHT